ncbi:MAG: class I adenylate-forming enzyme family protein [Acidimicrobiia bacterium]
MSAVDDTVTVATFARALADAYGDREAVVDERRRSTYVDLDRESVELALRLIERGVGKGDRIGMWMGNSVDWVVAFFAIARCGAVAVPLSTFFREPELARVVRHADLRGLLTDRTFLGNDCLSAIERALPGLAKASHPYLALKEAPYLRWVATIEAHPDMAPWATVLRVGRPTGVPPATEALLREIEREVYPADDAIMIYTSGSTAEPKGVPHSNAVVVGKTHFLKEAFEITEQARSYTASPFFWVGGLTMSLFPVLSAGGTQFCSERFDAGSFLRMVELERVTRAHLYPHHIEAILAHPDFSRRDRSSMREGDPRLLVRPAAPGRADGLKVGLGMTETFGGYWWGVPDAEAAAAMGPLRPGERRPPPLDRLAPGVELKVVDADGRAVGDGGRGEIVIRGWGVTRGLHKQPPSRAFDRNGFFHTGDEGEVRGRRVYFRGRLGDMIKTAGANVAPPEVEAALCSLDDISEAYVVPLDDPVRGQVVAAAVVPAPGAAVDADAVRSRLRDLISTFKVPVHIVVFAATEIPWTPSHKVKKPELAAMVAARVAR